MRDALESGIFSIQGTDSDGYPVIIIDGARLEEHGDNDNALRAMLHVGELALNAQPIRSEAKVSLLYVNTVRSHSVARACVQTFLALWTGIYVHEA